DVTLLDQFHTYSDPKRDPRRHTITTVYMARARGTPKAADDAAAIGIFRKDDLPEEMAFDHREILRDYFISRRAT
ncbi:MAG: NUDIX hydrolase, partial [Candidatus Latescibacteria bacterium]|nr:NUDIX hydrolase [Candidatus Latescibacterota bacterium]